MCRIVGSEWALIVWMTHSVGAPGNGVRSDDNARGDG